MADITDKRIKASVANVRNFAASLAKSKILIESLIAEQALLANSLSLHSSDDLVDDQWKGSGYKATLDTYTKAVAMYTALLATMNLEENADKMAACAKLKVRELSVGG